VLFDTYSIVFRAYHALPSLSTLGREPTSALYGACSLILKVLREHRPRRFAFAVDAPRPTFRHERYAEYKAQRPRAPTELVRQLERLPVLLRAFEAPVWCAPGYEADDVLATLTARLGAEGESVLVVSGDRDLLQLADQRVSIWFIGARGKDARLFDLAAVEERFGVRPQHLPAWTALVGDNSDNLEGAPGVGPRTATQLVATHGSIAQILEHLSEVEPAKAREGIRENAERLQMNEELARLRRDVELEPGPLAAPLTGAAVARLSALFDELEFKSLIPRLGALEVSA
jgi:DNA polymerase-1